MQPHMVPSNPYLNNTLLIAALKTFTIAMGVMVPGQWTHSTIFSTMEQDCLTSMLVMMDKYILARTHQETYKSMVLIMLQLANRQ
jgi:hypothetical protein